MLRFYSNEIHHSRTHVVTTFNKVATACVFCTVICISSGTDYIHLQVSASRVHVVTANSSFFLTFFFRNTMLVGAKSWTVS